MTNHGRWDDRLKRLNAVLADLYPTVAESRRVVSAAGLSASLIKFHDAAAVNWFNILETAVNLNRVDALLQEALTDFPAHEQLAELVGRPPGAADRTRPVSRAIATGTAVVSKGAVRDALVRGFSTDELAVLCADVQETLASNGIDLPVNLDVVGGTGTVGQVQNLIEYLDRRGYLSQLVDAIRSARPGLLARADSAPSRLNDLR